MSKAAGDKSTGTTTDGRGVLDVAVYVVARLLLVVAVSAVIYGIARLLGVAEFPVAVAALSGLVIAMPLGMWLFGRMRRRATAVLEVSGERRRKERDRLQARLRGEAVPDEAIPDEADPGPPA